MIKRITDILLSLGIDKYLINKTVKNSCELFFIRKEPDTRRIKDVTDYSVTVYRDLEKEGTRLRGSAPVSIFPSMTDEEISECLKKAYFAARFAANPYYELVKGSGQPQADKPTAVKSAEEAVRRMANALYSADNDNESFINSAEFFGENQHIRIVNSEGVNVSFDKFTIKGEFVTQCKTEEDVELYYSFEYDDINEDALAKKAADGIKEAKDRSVAKRSLKSGNYDIILNGEELAEILSYYTYRSDAAYIYAKYSDYSVGTRIQGNDDEITGEKLNITCVATRPYSSEGTQMHDLRLIENGVLQAIHGYNRFSQYLGVKPTGGFEKIRLDAGTVNIDDMKKTPYLHTVKFSDFQIDQFTGHFGGEIRLAYLYDGKNITKVTGGSVNGIISQAQKNFLFSKEKYSDSSYEGPLAVKIQNVTVAGSN